MKEIENPSAFPVSNDANVNGDSGMTLRDWFAGQALVAWSKENMGNDWGTSGTGHGPAVAWKCYAIADAMLAERAKTGTDK